MRGKGIEPEHPVVRLLQHAVLPEELDRLAAGPVDADLPAANDAEAILETDLRAGIEAEQVARQIAEIAGAERPAEAVRDAERALESRQAQRRRQIDDREVRLATVEIAIRVVLGGLGGGRGRFVLRRCRLWPECGEHGARSDDS